MTDTRTLTDDIATVHALVLYMHNTHKDVIFNAAYGDHHTDDNRQEKVDIMNRGGLEMLWGYLDGAGRKRLVEAALDKYGEAASRANRV